MCFFTMIMILILVTLTASSDDFSKLGDNMKRVVMRFCTPKEQFNLHLASKSWSEYFNYRNVCDSDDAIEITVLQEKQSGAYIVQYNERHIEPALVLPLVMAFKTDSWKWKCILNTHFILDFCSRSRKDNVLDVAEYNMFNRKNRGLFRLLQEEPNFARQLAVLAISQINPKERIKTCREMNRLIPGSRRDSLGIYVSPLRAIVLLNDFSLLSAWIQQKNDADNRDADGYTALMQAAICCGCPRKEGEWLDDDQKWICEALLQNGADVNASPNQDPGFAPLRFLMKSLESRGRFDLLNQSTFGSEIMRLFLKHGANPNKVREWDGSTPLEHAVALVWIADHNENLVEILLKNGADPNLKSRGETCLSLAVRQQNENLCKIFLKYGAEVTIESDNGITALDLANSAATFHGNEKLVKLLSKKRKRIE